MGNFRVKMDPLSSRKTNELRRITFDIDTSISRPLNSPNLRLRSQSFQEAKIKEIAAEAFKWWVEEVQRLTKSMEEH